MEENGWGECTTSELRQSHEIIDLFVSGQDRISRKCLTLYENGRSLAEVSKLTGVPTASIFDAMKERKIKRRSRTEARKKNPPFGYAWLSGRLIINPVEYRTVQMILDLHQSGMRPYHIEKHLNANRIPTRSGGKWFARVVTNIIKAEIGTIAY